MDCCFTGITLQVKVVKRIEAILPLVAGGFALEQMAGADVQFVAGEGHYKPVASRTALIDTLVNHDCVVNQVNSETFKKKRKRYYQTHFDVIKPHIECIRQYCWSTTLYVKNSLGLGLKNKTGQITMQISSMDKCTYSTEAAFHGRFFLYLQFES